MNKLIINTLEKMFVTSDAATILREMEVVHPAAKLLVMAAQQQESEVRASFCPFYPVDSSLPLSELLFPLVSC